MSIRLSRVTPSNRQAMPVADDAVSCCHDALRVPDPAEHRWCGSSSLPLSSWWMCLRVAHAGSAHLLSAAGRLDRACSGRYGGAPRSWPPTARSCADGSVPRASCWCLGFRRQRGRGLRNAHRSALAALMEHRRNELSRLRRERKGAPGESALVADALVIHDTIAGRPDVDARRIVVFGRSLGTVSRCSSPRHGRSPA